LRNELLGRRYRGLIVRRWRRRGRWAFAGRTAAQNGRHGFVRGGRCRAGFL